MDARVPRLLPDLTTDTRLAGLPDRLRYVTMLETYCAQLNAAGITINPYVDRANLNFDRLPSQRQAQVLGQFFAYFKICASAVHHPDVRDLESPTLVWWALREMGLRPPGELFNHFTSEDVVEIYDANAVQIFRTFNFFDLVSYTLDDLLCREWYELYRRDDAITQEYLRITRSIFDGTVDTIIYPKTIPDHEVCEISSEDHRRALIQQRFLSPLWSRDGNRFMFNAFRVRSASVA